MNVKHPVTKHFMNVHRRLIFSFVDFFSACPVMTHFMLNVPRRTNVFERYDACFFFTLTCILAIPFTALVQSYQPKTADQKEGYDTAFWSSNEYLQSASRILQYAPGFWNGLLV